MVLKFLNVKNDREYVRKRKVWYKNFIIWKWNIGNGSMWLIRNFF